MPEDANWDEFGRLLIHRRIQMDQAYYNRRTFAEQRKIGYHVAYRLEKGQLHRIEEATKAAVENAYDLAPGSFDRSVAALRLEPREAEGARQEYDPVNGPSGDLEIEALQEQMAMLQQEMARLRALVNARERRDRAS